MAERIDEEGRVLHGCDAGHSRDQETTDGTTHSTVNPTQECRKNKAGDDSDQHIVFLLPANKRVAHEIIDVIPWWLDLAAEHDPTDVSVPEALGDIIRITIRIDEFMVATMIRSPGDDVVFKGRCPEDERQETHRPCGFEGKMREKPMIAERDAEAGGDAEKRKHADLKGINAIMVKIPWNERECEDRRGGQE